ncbi:DNA-binding transcriptional regulator, MerR family [Paenibacillus sp. UNC496MF]|uniref:MerR family transcriptional regulator n=1 Tax=Paenibacillus sp. UNC496MF TaxID=1502753 RepID=UPI0008E4A8EC|nr:MerR family transcriptional regulator [Paenibacillus sp. UNC496MF]SFI35548.1 DNA-binding transcriptional regulator, MerR family [Paenibacillus sp. UNC496MF]
MAAAARLTMEEVTERLGITSRTLHYYEEIGLLPDVARTEGRHRVYDEETVDRIAHILRLKQVLGASLQEIRDILNAEEELERIKASYRGESRLEERDRLLDEAAERLRSIIAHIDEKMEKLQAMRQGFRARLERAHRLKGGQSE